MTRTSVPASLRVALFSGGYNCAVDGAVKVLNRLVKFLEDREIPVLIFSPTVKNPPFKHVGRLVPVPSIPFPFRREYRMSLGLTPAAKRELMAFRPTLMHVSVPDLLGFGALKAARQLDCPVVGSFHTRFDTYCRYYHMGWIEPYMVDYMRNFYNKCAHVYAPSIPMVKILQDQGIGHDVRPWSRGVDRDLFSPTRRDLSWRRGLGFGDEEVVIAFVGRLVLEKGLQHFARVHDALKARGVAHRVLIVGDGPARDRMAEWAPDAVFTGFLDGEDLARGYASSDIFFNPSITETFGNVTLEAMASGVAPVCARTPGHLAMIVEGATGFLAAHDDVDEAADKIAALAFDTDHRREIGLAARAATRRFTWDAVMNDILGYYHEVLGLEAAPRRSSFVALPGDAESVPQSLSKTGT